MQASFRDRALAPGPTPRLPATRRSACPPNSPSHLVGDPGVDAEPSGQQLGQSERSVAILNAVGIPADQCVVTSARTRDGVRDLREAIEGFVAEKRIP